MKASVKKHENGGVTAVRASARQIWLAGLGALSLAEDQSGKLFKALVKRGRVYQHVSEERLDRVKKTLDVRAQAATAIGKVTGKVTSRLDDGLTELVHQVGLPTHGEIQALDKRVERLTTAIEHRGARPRKRPRPRRAKSAESLVS